MTLDTKVHDIQSQVQSLIFDLKDKKINLVLLKEKYNYLYITSKTLFDFIVKNVNSKNFDRELFNLNLNKMLNYIVDIQNNNLTQNDASEHIGGLLAKQFIPQLK